MRVLLLLFSLTTMGCCTYPYNGYGAYPSPYSQPYPPNGAGGPTAYPPNNPRPGYASPYPPPPENGPRDYLQSRPPSSPSDYPPPSSWRRTNSGYDDYGWTPADRMRQPRPFENSNWDPYANPATPWNRPANAFARPTSDPYRGPGFRDTRWPF